MRQDLNGRRISYIEVVVDGVQRTTRQATDEGGLVDFLWPEQDQYDYFPVRQMVVHYPDSETYIEKPTPPELPSREDVVKLTNQAVQTVAGVIAETTRLIRRLQWLTGAAVTVVILILLFK